MVILTTETGFALAFSDRRDLATMAKHLTGFLAHVDRVDPGGKTAPFIYHRRNDHVPQSEAEPEIDTLKAGCIPDAPARRARPVQEWTEDMGPVLGWRLPVCEPPYVGQPNGKDWPPKCTYFTPIILPEPLKPKAEENPQ